MNDVVELLQALIRIPSVNPAGNPGTDGVGEKACAEFIAGFLTNCRAQVELRQVLPGRPNVLGTFSSDARKGRVLLAPHTDTVSVAGMTIDPFGGEERDGRIWGRGASDTKGCIAAMLWALHEMQDHQFEHEIVFAGLMGEEAGLDGSRALSREMHADFALVGEPTNLDIVHTHKGTLWMELKTHGTAAHGSTPERGANAIYSMLDAISVLRHQVIPEFAAAPDPVLGCATINVGTINGGSKSNIVPDSCDASVDVRIVPGMDDIEGELRARLEKAVPGIEVSTRKLLPMVTDPAHRMVAMLRKNGARCVGAPWFCDAAMFAEAGIPSVAAGPGSIAQAHTEDEWIDIAELRRGVEFYKAFLAQL